MGASAWDYWVPYQDDINKALQELRQEEFERRKPYKLDERNWIWQQSEEEYFLNPDLMSLDEVPEEELVHFRRMKALKEPSNIAELLNWTSTEGTHTIIDMTNGVAPTPKPFAVSPVSDEQLLKLFGTDKPTRSMVEERERDLWYLPDARRWQGFYIIVYKDGEPHEIYFTGSSGD